MGLLDSVVGAIGQQMQGSGSAASGGGSGALLSAVMGMLGGQGGLGGLSGLVGQFQNAGLGHVVNSWIGTGENHPISADQLGGVLGQDTVAGLAQQTGLDSGALLGQLSQLLPQVVDKLTPQGQLPQGGDLASMLGQGGLGDMAGLLGGLLKR